MTAASVALPSRARLRSLDQICYDDTHVCRRLASDVTMGTPLASEVEKGLAGRRPAPPTTQAHRRHNEASMITVILFMLLGWFGCTLVMTIYASRATEPVA
jgi:hypothetical protein